MNDEIYYDVEMFCYNQNRWCVIDTDNNDQVLLIGSYDECVDYVNKNLDKWYFVDIWD